MSKDPPPWVGNLAKTLDTLAQSLEKERATVKEFTEKVRGMEENLNSLQNMSELLSIRYNPFIGDQGGAAFRDDDPEPLLEQAKAKRPTPAARAPPDEAPAGQSSPAQAGPKAQTPPADLPPPHVCDEACKAQRSAHAAAHAPGVGHPPSPGLAKPSPTAEPPTQAPATDHHAGGTPSAGVPPGTYQPPPPHAQPAPPTMNPAHHVPPTPWQPSAPMPPPTMPRSSPPAPRRIRQEEPSTRGRGQQPTGPGFGMRSFGNRETYMALAWFEYLAAAVDPPTVHPFLDYYRGSGWLTEEAHEWLGWLAEGIEPRSQSHPEALYQADPGRLARLHMGSLRFLNALFSDRLDEREATSYEDEVRSLMEDR